MIVQRFESLGPTESLDVGIDLHPDGRATVFLDGIVLFTCVNGVEHEMNVGGEMHVDSNLQGMDMDDLEWAIRGRRPAAQRMAWRWASMVAHKRGVDPCDDP